MQDDDDVPVKGDEQETGTQAPESEVEEQQDETGELPESGGKSAEAEEPRRKQSFSERMRSEIDRRKAAEDELARYREHVLQMQQRSAPPPRLAEDPEAERQRLEQMDDVARYQYLDNKWNQRYAVQEQQFALKMEVVTDRLAFERKLADNPQWRRYEDQVERAFQDCLRRGQPRTRNELLSTAIGDEVQSNSQAAITKAKKAGAANIARQTTKPVSVRSGVGGESSRGESAEEILRRRLASGEYWR